VAAAGLLAARPRKPPPLLAPRSVAAGTPAATTVRASWRAGPASLKPDGFLVLRDGRAAGSALSCTGRGLVPGAAHACTVIATAGQQRSRASGGARAAALIAPPSRLALTGRDWTTAAVSWAAPAGAPAPDACYLYSGGSDGRLVATIPGRARSYVITRLAPGQPGRYVVAAGWPGHVSPSTAAVTAAARQAPLGHDDDVGYRVTSIPGKGASLRVGQARDDTWSFTPSCAGKGCAATRADVSFDPPDFTESEFTMTLRLSGDRYTGTATAKITTCGGTPPAGLLAPSTDPPTDVTSTITVSVAPVAARDGAWASWRASMRLSSPDAVRHELITGEYGECPPQSWTFTASGHPAG
jgi:hypothetical protein